jgi:methylmalonyl-CoA mutase N-terminal domain/subunit
LSVPAPDYSGLEKSQVKRVKALRKKRSAADVKRSLEAIRAASADTSRQLHLMPLIVDAVRARSTVGEISDTLAANWGLYRPAL